jgi:hypothetical protein
MRVLLSLADMWADKNCVWDQSAFTKVSFSIFYSRMREVGVSKEMKADFYPPWGGELCA